MRQWRFGLKTGCVGIVFMLAFILVPRNIGVFVLLACAGVLFLLAVIEFLKSNLSRKKEAP